MKKNILLIQFRKNILIAKHEKECIFRYLGNKANLMTKNLFKAETCRNPLSKISGVIIGGSGEFSFSEKEKSPELWKRVKNATPFIKKIIKEDIPTLGICLGHHYLAYVLGSEVITDKSQQEIGTFNIYLTESGKTDPLFSEMPSEFFVQQGHKDSIKKLPNGATLLARGKKCRIQAFSFNNIYGVEFHPELGIEDMRFRISRYPDYLSKDNKFSLKSSPFAKKVLENFSKLI